MTQNPEYTAQMTSSQAIFDLGDKKLIAFEEWEKKDLIGSADKIGYFGTTSKKYNFPENWKEIKPSFIQEFRNFWGQLGLPKCTEGLEPKQYITCNNVVAADMLHPGFKTYEVLVHEDGLLYKYIVLFQFRQAPFSHIQLRCGSHDCY